MSCLCINEKFVGLSQGFMTLFASECEFHTFFKRLCCIHGLFYKLFLEKIYYKDAVLTISNTQILKRKMIQSIKKILNFMVHFELGRNF